MVRTPRRRRLLHDPHAAARHDARPSASPTAACTCTSRSATPASSSCRTCRSTAPTYPATGAHVVNAYEPHEHVYEALLRTTGPGAGARWWHRRVAHPAAADGRPDEQGRADPDPAPVPHLLRRQAQQVDAVARRRGAYGFAFQGFNAPKSAWGGIHTRSSRSSRAQARKDLYELTGGAHTPYRKLWLQADEAGPARRAGTHTFQGEVTDVYPSPTDGVITEIKQTTGGSRRDRGATSSSTAPASRPTSVSTASAPTCSTTPGIGRNPLGRVDVEISFEVRGAAQRSAAGCTPRARRPTAATSQGVDTFLGLQFVRPAHRRRSGVDRVRHEDRADDDPSRTWWKWMRHKEI